MNVTTSSAGVAVQPHGPLDEDGCAALRQVISTALSTGLRSIVLDLSEVSHIETEAVQLLRGVQHYLQRHGGALVVVRPSADAARGLRSNDLADLLVLGDTLAPVRPLRAVRAG
ncbi:MAG: hypothetical protein JWO22_496 [Frankiales bacterium]|nr:hypothetical protein [Frankiales bacterium]